MVVVPVSICTSILRQYTAKVAITLLFITKEQSGNLEAALMLTRYREHK